MAEVAPLGPGLEGCEWLLEEDPAPMAAALWSAQFSLGWPVFTLSALCPLTLRMPSGQAVL
jgi:hypothetical protein